MVDCKNLNALERNQEAGNELTLLYDRLEAVAQAIFDRCHIVPDVPDARACLTMALLTRKLLENLRAIRVLNKAGLTCPALILAWPVIETCATILYIWSRPTERLPLFWDDIHRQRSKLGKKICKANPGDTDLQALIGSIPTPSVQWPYLDTMLEELGDAKDNYEMAKKAVDYEIHPLPLMLARGITTNDGKNIVGPDQPEPPAAGLLMMFEILHLALCNADKAAQTGMSAELDAIAEEWKRLNRTKSPALLTMP